MGQLSHDGSWSAIPSRTSCANSPSAPSGWERPQAGLPQGKLTPFEFPAGSPEVVYPALLYTPPNYDPKQRYPVVYLLHGASGNEKTWTEEIGAHHLLDQLIAKKLAVPMLVVMPCSRPKSDTNAAPRRENPQAAMAFADTLVHDLVPWIEKKLPVQTDRKARAVAGLSMGGGLALKIATSHSDRFGTVGAFSGVGRRWILPETPLDTLWISVGDRDSLVRESVLEARAFFESAQVPLVFKIHEGGHEAATWRSDWYHFAQLLFKHPKTSQP